MRIPMTLELLAKDKKAMADDGCTQAEIDDYQRYVLKTERASAQGLLDLATWGERNHIKVIKIRDLVAPV
jgi:hypothetical protein